jgi:hypothetical protein
LVPEQATGRALLQICKSAYEAHIFNTNSGKGVSLLSQDIFRQLVSTPFTAVSLARGVARVLSRTVVSPFEVLKISYQEQKAGREEYKLSIWRAFKKMWTDEGFPGSVTDLENVFETKGKLEYIESIQVKTRILDPRDRGLAQGQVRRSDFETGHPADLREGGRRPGKWNRLPQTYWKASMR